MVTVGEVWDVCLDEGSYLLEMGFESVKSHFQLLSLLHSGIQDSQLEAPATISVTILAAMSSASLS